MKRKDKENEKEHSIQYGRCGYIKCETIARVFCTLAHENSKDELVGLQFSSTAHALPEFLTVISERRVRVPFSMDIEKVELVHECSPEHMRMTTVRLK